jgi:hypothetical protein
MKEPLVFDRLIKELDDQERRALLLRIQSSVPAYTELLQPEKERLTVFSPQQEQADLGLLERILLFFRSLLSGRDREAMLRERYLRRLLSRIERDHPALIDGARSRFREGMYQELLVLKAGARSLHEPLLEVIDRHRREFLAFLGRGELGDFRERLEEETDPRSIWDSGRFSEETQVREVMLQRFDELIGAIPQASKQQLGREALALFSLYELSRHPFDALLAPFQGEQPSAGFRELSGPLKELAECIESVRVAPSERALCDLLLFLHQERLEDQDFDLERQLMDDMSTIHAALAGIRMFRERVPLHGLLRLITRDPEYYPAASSSSGDWFSYYRDYWHQWVHRRYLDFFHSRRREALLSESLVFLDMSTLPHLANYRPDKFGGQTPVRHELSLSFIKGFLEGAFASFYRPLKLIYLNAEFYKEENRRAYTDAFLFVSEAGNKIEEIEAALGPQGHFRAAIQEVKAQAIGERLRQKRIVGILGRADGQARAFVDAFLDQLESLKALLYGILKGQPGERFDTLVNLDRLGGRENSDLRKAWGRALEKTDQGVALLRKIRDLEINL